MSLLTETADYDTPGSWGPASDGWPGIRGDHAYDMYVFANCIQSIPYGSYVLMSRKGEYGATESYLRVSPSYIQQLIDDYASAGKPDANACVARREKFGRLNKTGNREAAPKWW